MQRIQCTNADFYDFYIIKYMAMQMYLYRSFHTSALHLKFERNQNMFSKIE